MEAGQEIHRHAREIVGSLVDVADHVQLGPKAEPVFATVPPEEPVAGPTGLRVRALLHQGVTAALEVESGECGIKGVVELTAVSVDRQVDARSDRFQLPWRQSENGCGVTPVLQTHLAHANEAHRFSVVDDVRQLADPGQIFIFCYGCARHRRGCLA